MNEAGDNMVSYSTCRLKYLPDIDIGAYDVDIGASYGQVFVRVNNIDIGAYDINIGASYGQVFVWVNDIDIRAYDINIRASYGQVFV